MREWCQGEEIGGGDRGASQALPALRRGLWRSGKMGADDESTGEGFRADKASVGVTKWR